jgi:hypothetical protein
MVKVICRIKPPLYENTIITKDNELLFTKKEKDIKNDYKYNSKYYKLDKFYNEKSTNNEIFYDEVKPLLINSFYLFLYGHTGSGKTYTLFGNDYVKGIIYYIFKEINYDAEIEAIELRSTGCYNLLNNRSVSLLENEKKINLYNVERIKIKNFSNFQQVFDDIKYKRKTGISKYNQQSSRTHLVINIFHNGKKYVVVDLAGNERAPDMKKGISYDETSYINSSLLSLKECFRQSSFNNKKYIPYRRSKLTRLLKDVFETKVNSLIISTIHSGLKYQNDTYDTLMYLSQFHKKFEQKINDYNTVQGSNKKLLKVNTKNKKNLNLIKPNNRYEHLKRPHTSPKYKSNNKKNDYNLKPVYKQNRNNYDKLNVKDFKFKVNNFTEYKKNDNMNNDKKYKYDKYHDKNPNYEEKYDDDEKNNLIENTRDKKYKKDDFYKKSFFNNLKYKNPSDEYAYKDSNYLAGKIKKEYYNDKIVNNHLLKKINYDEDTIKMLGILNHILYSQSIKNIIQINEHKSIEERSLNVLNKTMATIEVVLEEIIKLYSK